MAAAAAASMAAAGSSHASVLMATYNLDGASGGVGGSAPYGTVTVDDAGGVLAFTIQLEDNLVFRNAPDSNHWSFGFDLDVTGATIGSISDNGTGSFDPITGAQNFSPFGTFNYVVDCDSGCSTGYSASSPTKLQFTVTGAGGATLTVNDIELNGSENLFATDVASGNSGGGTGNIGANSSTIMTGVPEPAAWALMLMGFGGLGALLRSRRRHGYKEVA